MKKSKSVLVVGAGIAGIQASLDLADLGADVHLIEETPSIGGRMPQLDKTFPTNDCSVCILAPKMTECARHPNIVLHPYSSLTSISGSAGSFSCEITEHAKYVDPEKCVACGLCEQKCPSKVLDEFDTQLRQRKSIYRYFLQSIPSSYVIDAEHCLYLTKGACKLCEKACPAEAVNFDDEDKIVTLNCGAVVLASGIDPYDPVAQGQYGYKRFKNVVTSIEFERMLSASGPQRGHVVCPSSGETPKSLAFIQCVGSRDIETNEYCSSVCCMYAIKEAIIAKEHMKGLEATIFFMDIRAFGKDFDRYYERAENQFGVNFVRSKVARIAEVDENTLRLRFTEENGKRNEQDFDMVVLSVGLNPRKGADEFLNRLGAKSDEYGFCRTELFKPLDTSREGILVCGATSGPKDIPESVMSASGAVAECTKFLNLKRQEAGSKKVFPAEIDVAGERPRIGVFVCNCGINIAGVVGVPKAVEFASSLRNVEYAGDLLYACSQDCLNTIKEKIEEHNLNRVLVAACTPRTHEPLFRETLREAGLNQYLFEMANIRDQCSWAHMNEPELATQKAIDLIQMGVAKARNLTPLEKLPVDIDPGALVIGGGLSGMTAALAIAHTGYKVSLIEKEKHLGGNLRNIYSSLEGDDPQKLLEDTVKKVQKNKLITVHTKAEIKEINGYIGNYKTTIRTEDRSARSIASLEGNAVSLRSEENLAQKKRSGEKTGKARLQPDTTKTKSDTTTEIEHGIVVVATGAEESGTEEYLRGKSKRVMTQFEFEKQLSSETNELRPKTVVMIQCVNSREEGRPYCSRICCGEAVKNSLKLKEVYPNAETYILYRDVRTYGLKEKYYGAARDKGIMFMRYDLDHKPKVELADKNDPDSKLKITTFDPVLDSQIIIEADLLVLSVSIGALEENKKLAKLLKVPLNADGFFLEAHVKLRPVDFATDGIFVCGLAHGPKYIEESIVQAEAAGARALTILTKKSIEAEGTICYVNPDRCSGCGSCVAVCAYSAADMNEEKGVAEINEAMCKGCGACAATCRCGAIDLRGFTGDQIFEAVSALAFSRA
jgi:heterodisulfide reductase subunit A